jgi:hypothetical protein
LREPNRYARLKAEHEAALEEKAETRGPAAPSKASDTPPDLGEEIEARLATYDYVQLPRMEAGLITPAEYANRRLQLDQDLAREIQSLPTRTEFQATVDGPTLSAEQTRQAEISPPQTEQARKADELTDKLARGREVSDRDQARVERLLDQSSSDEREMRLDQEIGNSPSRGRGR